MAGLDAETLASILETEGFGLIPLSAEQRMRAVLEIRSSMRTASTDDEDARALRKRLDYVAQLMNPESARRLADLPLFWIDSSLPHAAAIHLNGAPAILVCRGLFDLVHYQTALNSVCSLLGQVERDRGMEGDPEQLPSGRMNLAGYVILADAYRNLRPPATLADLLGPKARHDVDVGVSTSMVLLLLHELGHVALGHTRTQPIGGGTAVDVVPEPPASDVRMQLELEADAFSLDAIADRWQAQMLASLICLHNVFHFFEVFGVRPSQEYPLAERRLAALIERMPLSGADLAFAESWLSDYRRRQAIIAAEPRTAEQMVDWFDRTMDVAAAYRVVDQIRTDLTVCGIVLEKPEEDPQATR